MNRTFEEHDLARVVLSDELPDPRYVVFHHRGIWPPVADNEFCYFFFDPLTGETASDFEVSALQSVVPVCYPCDESFLIDSVATFYDFRSRQCVVRSQAQRESFAEKFIGHFQQFLKKSGLAKSESRADLRILSDDFDELGFDFMRQHYRRIQEAADREDLLPDHAEFDHWLTRTKSNRTTDGMWPLNGQIDWHRHSSISLTLENYPCLQTTRYLHLYGSRVSDVSLLEKCVRLTNLRLHGVAATNLDVLATVPTLTCLELRNLTIDLRSVGAITTLESLSLDGMKITGLSSLAGLSQLSAVTFVDCHVDETELAAFRKARPDVRIDRKTNAASSTTEREPLSAELHDVQQRFRDGDLALVSYRDLLRPPEFLVIDGAITGDEFNCFTFDPLSGEVVQGMAYCSELDLEWIRPTDYPCSDSFLIDSVESFTDYSPWGWRDHPDERYEQFAKEFLPAFNRFLTARGLRLLESRSELQIHSDELNELGFDYMRQHYRRIKADSVRAGVLPKTAELDHWLQETQSNRTSDGVWPFLRCYGWDTHGSLPISQKNYPYLQTATWLRLCGPRIDDLSLLRKCVRLRNLELQDVAATNIDALTAVQSLYGLTLKRLSIDISLTGSIKTLSDVTLQEMQVETLKPFETLPRLEFLRLFRCEVDEQELSRFKQLRPEVKLHLRNL